jgi:polyphosphate kinase
MDLAETMTRKRGKGRGVPNLNHPTYYFNRELSWLRFNERVLEEALDASNPLLERVRFLSIFGGNLDEFFMIRVSGLRRQLVTGVHSAPPDGLTPAEQLAAIRERILPTLDRVVGCWRDDLLPKLEEQGIHVTRYGDLEKKQRKLLRRHFEREIFPALTPLAFDPGHPFPHISNLSINLAVVVDDPEHGERFARLKVPASFPRLVRIPAEERADPYERLGLEPAGPPSFVWLEEVVAANLDLLFPGLGVIASYPFRVTRDADVEIEEDEAGDLLTAMVEVVGQRHFGSAVRLEIDERMPRRIRDILTENLALAPYQVYVTKSPIGRADLAILCDVDRPDLRYPQLAPVYPPCFEGEDSVFHAIRREPVVLHHPYDSFTPVMELLQEAAEDPDVLAIKQTLYRIGPDSPVVATLAEARENGKQVSVLVELKARFDEANNITWARALEHAGVHVVYGILGLKTHAKILLVVRRERDGLRRYVHLSTGNYNPITARVYTDVGYFSSDPVLAEDVSDLFNALTGYSLKNKYRKLLVAPGAMREGILSRIRRETRLHEKRGGGYLAFKMNSLVDKACIRALYEASRVGVEIDLQVRGICCLRPGVPRVSETIRVTSIVGRFLEHSRIYYFRNGGEEEMLLGSADLMPRNLDGRVELLFPVEEPDLLAALRDDVLRVHLRDNVGSWILDAEGEYTRARPADGEEAIDSQLYLLEHGGSWRRGRD